MNKQRQLIYFRGYFWEFFNKQSEKVKEKIDQVLHLVTVAEKIPKKELEKAARIKEEYFVYKKRWRSK